MGSTREETLAAIYTRGDRLRSTRRRRWVGLLGAGAVACVVAGVLLWPRPGHRAQSVATTPATTPRAASARELATGEWSAMPDPPFAWLDATQGAWDGHELVVWGPLADHTMAAAAYDPGSRAWRELPAPPLSPRTNASVVWTGTEIVAWGGVGFRSPELFADGAAYDPARSSWRPLAPSPLSARYGATIVWAGNEVIILGGSTRDGTLANSARYNPAVDEWHSVAALPGGAHDLDQLTGVWAGDRMVVADSYETATHVDANTTSFQDGIAFYSYDQTTDAWSTLASSGIRGVDQLIWTGSAVLATPARAFCGLHSCPSFPAPPGSLLDLRTNAWRPIAAGPVDDGGVNVWTGAALLRVASNAAAWDSATDTWARVQSPAIGFVPSAITAWTGDAALLWETTYVGGGNDRSTGLQLTVSPSSPTPSTAASTPTDVAAQLQSVQGVDPVLVPTAVPADWHAEVAVREAGYDVTYTGPNGERVLLSVSIPNPPPPTDTGTQELGFRNDPQGLYQQQDANDPVTDRYLLWNEPGQWVGDGPGAPARASVPYYVFATGVTDSVFRQIVDSLTPLRDVH